MHAVDILRKARRLYASAPSHAPGHLVPEPGTYCVIYGLHAATYGSIGASMDIEREGDYWSARDMLLEVIGDHAISLARWNAERTTEEVLAVLDRAIELATMGIPVTTDPHEAVLVA